MLTRYSMATRTTAPNFLTFLRLPSPDDLSICTVMMTTVVTSRRQHTITDQNHVYRVASLSANTRKDLQSIFRHGDSWKKVKLCVVAFRLMENTSNCTFVRWMWEISELKSQRSSRIVRLDVIHMQLVDLLTSSRAASLYATLSGPASEDLAFL